MQFSTPTEKATDKFTLTLTNTKLIMMTHSFNNQFSLPTEMSISLAFKDLLLPINFFSALKNLLTLYILFFCHLPFSFKRFSPLRFIHVVVYFVAVVYG